MYICVASEEVREWKEREREKEERGIESECEPWPGSSFG